jgi:rod shape-determining protein MreD
MNARTIHPGLFTALWLLPLLALLQTSLMNHVAVGGAIPALILLVVVDWGILRGPDQGMLWAFVGGLGIDVFSSWPFGTSTVALVIVASVVSLGGGTFIRTHALLPPAAVFLATILYYLIAFFILESVHHPVDWIPTLRGAVLPIAAYNAILNIPVYWLVRRLEARVYPVPRANW